MCVICRIEGGEYFDPEFVKVYCKQNPHGYGFMWPERDKETKKWRVKLHNSMGNPDNAAELFQKFLDAKVDFAFHCRLASAGEKNLANTHPVSILSIDRGDPVDVAMMHNGTFYSVGGEKNMSDTYNFATYYLRPLFQKYNEIWLDEDFQELLDSLIGHNKLVFVDSNRNWVTINEGAGQFYEDNPKIWISNKDKPSTVYVDRKSNSGSMSPFPYGSNFGQQPSESSQTTKQITGAVDFSHAPHDPKKDGNDGIKGFWKFDKDGRSNFERIQVGNDDAESWSDRSFEDILADVQEFAAEEDFFKFCTENPYEAVDCMYRLARTDTDEYAETIKKSKESLLLEAMADPIGFADTLGCMVWYTQRN